jgi:hypothetical protein
MTNTCASTESGGVWTLNTITCPDGKFVAGTGNS